MEGEEEGEEEPLGAEEDEEVVLAFLVNEDGSLHFW